MKKEFYQSIIDYVRNKAIVLDLPRMLLCWDIDGVISCANHDEEITFDEFNFLMEHRNTILEDYKNDKRNLR